MTDAHVVTNKK